MPFAITPLTSPKFLFVPALLQHIAAPFTFTHPRLPNMPTLEHEIPSRNLDFLCFHIDEVFALEVRVLLYSAIGVFGEII